MNRQRARAYCVTLSNSGTELTNPGKAIFFISSRTGFHNGGDADIGTVVKFSGEGHTLFNLIVN